MAKHHHFIINKPFGYLSQFVYNQSQRRNKKLLGDLSDFPDGTMAIGRLDEKSEGLLLLTTDGQVSEQVRSKKIEKEYFVQLDGEINEEAIAQLQNGIEISLQKGKHKTLPCEVKKLDPAPVIEGRKKERDARHGPTSWISITLREGKFRQIRKMTATVGFPTLRLVRVRIGSIMLEGLRPGQVLEVSSFKLD
ncbi:MAG: pseudouridine synthase [Bacteroidota bacterium]